MATAMVNGVSVDVRVNVRVSKRICSKQTNNIHTCASGLHTLPHDGKWTNTLDSDD